MGRIKRSCIRCQFDHLTPLGGGGGGGVIA